jgi:threonine dehydrogenase-like Zn-dependent dehydrogenase
MQTKGMILQFGTRSSEWEDLELPEDLASYAVLVEASWLGICHSDTELLEGDVASCADKSITAPLAQIQVKDLTINGFSRSGGVLPRALMFHTTRQIGLGPRASHESHLSEVSEAFEASPDGATVLKDMMRP